MMREGLLLTWQIWDQIYQHCSRLQYVDKENAIFRVVLLRYHGNSLPTRDGTVISNGDTIIKLHIHNCRLVSQLEGATNPARLGLVLRREVLNSLPYLAEFVLEHPQYQDIKGIVGTTMLHRGVKTLGFDVMDVPETPFYVYKNWYLKLMMQLMHPDGRERIKGKEEQLKVKRVYISKEELIRRYLPNSAMKEAVVSKDEVGKF